MGKVQGNSPSMPSATDSTAANIAFIVNGKETILDVDPATPLLFVLRNELGLKGAKLGCGLEQCGACAVLVDGKEVLSCSSPVGSFNGACIVTPECRDHALLTSVREAFMRMGAAQCGYCIPGMAIAATALLENNAKPDDGEIRQGLQRHLCRCGTHPRVMAAVKELADG